MDTQAKIVRRRDMRGGSLTIEGTRITVTDVVRNYWEGIGQVAKATADPPDFQAGCTIPFGPVFRYIQAGYPHLSEGQIKAALSYWRDHREEVQQELDEEDSLAKELELKHSVRP